MIPQQQPICRYFIEGRCKFDQNCRNSHDVVRCYLIRHAQSEFNAFAEQSEHDIYSQGAKKQYQTNPSLIDCGLTKAASKQIEQMNFQYNTYDCIFVSPLNRSLQTVDQIVRKFNIKCKSIIVVPNLTEVVSKICDFTGPVEGKIKKYPKFDFSMFKKETIGKLEQWQDRYVDEQYKNKIDKSKMYGFRYLNILQQIFPTPLECSQSCFNRTLDTIDEIKRFCTEKGFKNVMIISHNRILKYISGRFNGGRAPSFLNCQIKIAYI